MKPVGVKFERPSKIFYFDAGKLEVKAGSKVVVKTTNGHALATIVSIPDTNSYKPKSKQTLAPVVRLATDGDVRQRQRNRSKESDAFSICQKLIREMDLSMKLVKAQFTLGGGKVTFFFYSENRIDFRHLVKRLNQELRMKIEMTQVGVRDAAGIIGGIGICGREYCCSTFLTNFKPVSIKMAKTQNLSLNPEKVSGGCGRLRCCLTYELDVYHEVGKGLPKVGKMIETKQGTGKVTNVEVLKRLITVNLGEEGGLVQVRAEEIKPAPQNLSSQRVEK